MKREDSILGIESIPRPWPFKSFFMGGFECSTHRLRSGKRLDLVAATAHETFARQDYERMRNQNLLVAREGARWHLIESSPGHCDFSTAVPIVRAAQAEGVQVIWDLCHFGWPDHLDIFKPEFVSALSNFAMAFARWLKNETSSPSYFVPVNEISFFSWAAGDEGSIFPFATGRGFELKAQLVRAAIAAMDAIWSVDPNARFVQVDPVIHVVPALNRPQDKLAAEVYRVLQFQSFDLLSGRVWPELGGHERYLDIVGVNYYPHNQWIYNLSGFRRIRKFSAIRRSSPRYRPFREILAEVFERYHRPMIIAETGAENRLRPEWLRYVCEEAGAALANNVPIHGLCLYPVVNHPGWVDGRHCHNALWDYADKKGHREIYPPLADELHRWQKHFEKEDVSGDEADLKIQPVNA
jgi:hypothetical protein